MHEDRRFLTRMLHQARGGFASFVPAWAGSIAFRPDRSPVRRAFSLVELVLVTAILLTVTAIAAPRYGAAMSRYRIDAAAHRIALDLEYARTVARTTGKSVTVSFDTSAETYTIAGAAGLRDATAPYVVALHATPYRAALVTVAFDAADLADAVDAVIFDPYGIPDSGGTVTIASGVESRTVTLDATGLGSTGP